jgi:hypothetical protein
MKNVYDMVSWEFIEDESLPMQEVQSSFNFNEHHQRPAVQLQLVEQQASIHANSLPVDLALQTFLLTK